MGLHNKWIGTIAGVAAAVSVQAQPSINTLHTINDQKILPTSYGFSDNISTATAIKGGLVVEGGQGGLSTDTAIGPVTRYNFSTGGNSAVSCDIKGHTILFGLTDGQLRTYTGNDSAIVSIPGCTSSIDDIYVGENGKIYLATGGNGIYVLSSWDPLVIDAHITFGPGTAPNKIIRITSDRMGDYLCLRRGGDIVKIHNDTVESTDNLQGLPNLFRTSGKSLATGPDSTQRIGAQRGLARKLINGVWEEITLPERLKLESVNDIKVDSNGFVYLATTALSTGSYGLTVYDPATEERRRIDGFGPNNLGIEGHAMELGIEENNGIITLSVATTTGWYVITLEYGSSGISSMTANIESKPRVYPNPTTEILNLMNMNTSKIISAKIVDAKGAIVKDIEVLPGKGFDVGDLVPGTYHMVIVSEGEKNMSPMESIPFIKQ